jgi:calmodulin
MMANKTRNTDEEQEIYEAFEVFDRDNDGFISAAELGHILAVIGEESTSSEITDMIRQADQDGDGRISCT